MPATYTGVGSNVTASTSPTISTPSDGDPDNAATFATPLQKLLDYVANIFGKVGTGAVNHGDGTASYIQPTLTNSTTWVSVTGYQRAFSGPGVTATAAAGSVQAGAAGTYAINFTVQGSTDATSGGQYQFRVLKNGATALSDPFAQMPINGAAGTPFYSAAFGRATLAANDTLVLQILNVTGGTNTPKLASVSFTLDRLA